MTNMVELWQWYKERRDTLHRLAKEQQWSKEKLDNRLADLLTDYDKKYRRLTKTER